MYVHEHYVYRLRKCNHYESNQTLQGTRETNEANMRIAENLNNMNYKIQQEVNQTNLDLAKSQNDWNIQQWNRQNSYNDPSAQVDRLTKAGINPALVGGVGDAGNAGPLQSADLANQQAVHLDAKPELQNPYGSDWQAARNREHAKVMDTLTQIRDEVKLHQEIAESRQRIAASRSAMSTADAQLALQQGMQPYDIALKKAQTGLTDWQKERARIDALTSARLMNHEIEAKELDIAWAKSRNASALETLNRQRMENEVYQAQIPALKARPDLDNNEIRNRIAFMGKQMQMYDEQIEGQSLANQITEKDLSYFDKRNTAQIARDIEEYKNALEKGIEDRWRNEFRKKYGFSPDTPIWSALGTAFTSNILPVPITLGRLAGAATFGRSHSNPSQ